MGAFRKPVAAGNWKLHQTQEETRTFAAEFLAATAGLSASTEIIIAPTALTLALLSSLFKGSGVGVAAQNCHWEKRGAFTGEVSPELAQDAGAAYVLIGHSERRELFGESDDHVRRKIEAVQRVSLVPIVCVGETLAAREAGLLRSVLERQLVYGLEGVDVPDPERFMIAYEPVWAIGTGRTAGPADAQEAHAFIRSVLSGLLGAETADRIRILYGGSVKPDNAAVLCQETDVDGVLVGGASLTADSFAAIAKGVALAGAAPAR